MQSCQCEWEWETVALFFHSNFTFDVAFVRRGQLLICCSPASLLLLFYANLVAAAEREAATFRSCCCAMTLNRELIELTLTSRVTCKQQQITPKARVVMYTDLSLNLMTLSLFTALLAQETYMATLHLALSTRNQSTCSLSRTCLPTRYLTHLCTL